MNTSAPMSMRYQTYVTQSVMWNERLYGWPKALAAFSAWPERMPRIGGGNKTRCEKDSATSHGCNCGIEVVTRCVVGKLLAS